MCRLFAVVVVVSSTTLGFVGIWDGVFRLVVIGGMFTTHTCCLAFQYHDDNGKILQKEKERKGGNLHS
jgi:hypothetical protein